MITIQDVVAVWLVAFLRTFRGPIAHALETLMQAAQKATKKLGIRSTDKANGNSVDEYRPAERAAIIARIARHLGVSEQQVREELVENGWVETSFGIYELIKVER